VHSLIGIGLRPLHYTDFFEKNPAIGWLEVHSQNFFTHNTQALNTLYAIADRYPLSLHGIGLSLGAIQGIPHADLMRLKTLIERVKPCRISDHLSFGTLKNVPVPDLLTPPYTDETLDILCKNIVVAQDFLQCELLIENPFAYVTYQRSTWHEAHFLATACERTGAKILLDVNNIWGAYYNHGWDPYAYIDAIPSALIKEIHLAGHAIQQLSPTENICVDTHDGPVSQAVWDLYAYALKKTGPIPTLLEWDLALPSVEVLLQEARKALPFLWDARNARQHTSDG